MEPKINIAIDGYSSCGKSTVARQLAGKLHYLYVDSGAMYRAVTLYFLDNGIDWTDPAQVEKALGHIRISFRFNRDKMRSETFLNDINVEDDIRDMSVSNAVSPVSAVKAVRRFLVEQQQAIGAGKGVVMDGRDIGTVVFPDAALKIFMTASEDIRVMRRYKELMQKDMLVNIEEVRKNIQERDHEDTHRAESPLTRAPDALLLDNSSMTREEQLAWILQQVEERKKK